MKKSPDLRVRARWTIAFWAGVLLINPAAGVVSGWAMTITDFPLEPPDTSSPRATVESFLENMQEAHRVFTAAFAQYNEEPGWYPSQAVKDQIEDVFLFLDRAKRCLDLSEVPQPLLERVGLESTLLLKTIFDRINLPPLESIPNADQVVTEDILRWRVPHTELTIAKVAKGPHQGEFLFSPATVERLDQDYERIKHLPHKPGGWAGVYTLYTEVSGKLIPDKLVYQFPDWARTRYLNHPLWKWMSAAIVFVTALLLLGLVRRLSRGNPDDRPLRKNFRRIIFPVSIMVLAYLLDYLQKEIGFIGDVTEVMTTVLLAVTFLGAGWTVLLTGRIIAESVIASPRIASKGLDAAMIRVASQIISFGIAAWIIIIGAQTIGIPLVPVLAGLGVGGLALALSAKPTVENFIGGMTLFADQPVRLGEMVKFGDQFGMVEEIGMRSTRIRTLDRTLVTVPNAEFSKLHLENFNKRDKIWFHPSIRLRLDTTPDQLRYILVEIRKVLYAHPKVLEDPARIRFVEFGTYSLDLDVFAYIDATDYGEYLEIAEDLHLRMMEVVTRAGASLAIPSSREYEEEAEKVDEQRVREIEAEVEAWRETGSLYLPSFPEDKIKSLQGTLDYPPPGAPRPKS